MNGRRLAIGALQLLIAFQGAFVAAAPQPMAVAAAAPTAAPSGAPSGATGCTVTAGGSGGIVSACADAATYAEFAAALATGFTNLTGASATSHLTVTSDPVGADVVLNGLQAGTTPLDATFPAGTYLVRVTKDGYVPFSRTVTITADKPGTLNATLEAMAGSEGAFEWVRPAQIINLLGSAGYPDGTFDIGGYVRDKDGADYISFANSKVVEFNFDEPTEFDHSRGWQKGDRGMVTTVGVARSRDDGATWTLLKSWTGSYTAREWTSAEFDDSQWATGDPGTIKSRWIRAYYYARKSEAWTIWAMVPKPEGGVAVYATKITFDQPQELMTVWDSLPTYNANGYCRADDTDRLCLMAPHQGRYMTSLVPPYTGPSLVEAQGSDGRYKSVASPSAISRYGVTQLDLATYNSVQTVDTTVFTTLDGGETSTNVEPFCCGATYQGSYKGADYFLTRDGGSKDVKGYIYVARNGAAPVLETTYTLGADAPIGHERSEELRIGPDGTLYILDQVRGMVFVLENGNPVLLGRVPASVWGGLMGPTTGTYLSAAVDSGGNVQAAFRVGSLSPDGTTYTTAKDYYEYFARQKPNYQSVALFTTANCEACDQARDWLTAAGVSFRENPTDLSGNVNTSVGAAVGSAGYPVVARLGTDNVVRGGADPVTISALLGVSYPVLVDTHPVRLGKTAPGVVDQFNIVAYQPDWVLMVLESDQPRVVVQRDEGVVAFAPAAGSWTSTKLLNSPPPVPVTVIDGATGFDARYPLFPGGDATSLIGTARDVPFNTITKVGDLRFLYRSEGGDRSSYTLNTTKSASTSSAYRAIGQVSQLIPATEFSIALGAAGQASKVKGELASYVTAQETVTNGGDRFYRVVADLRTQNETAMDGNITPRGIGGTLEVTTETSPGVSETREISLILAVDNTRLQMADPQAGGRGIDLTSEAVHFTGDNERWVVTNNLGIPNAIPCGTDQELLLPPHATSTFTAADVRSWALGSCMDALEVAPMVLTGCQSWADVQLILGAQTIDALSQSLALERTEESTNYELTYGSRDAAVLRIISTDELQGDTPACATELTGSTAAVVRVSGRIIGDNEAFNPLVTIADSGKEAVKTAPTAQPGSLAWERGWLEFEATSLELNLKVAFADQALAKVLSLTALTQKRIYQGQLLATRALLHCNYEGTGMAEVLALVDRSAGDPEALRRSSVCLQGFVLRPFKHWLTFDRAIWDGGQFLTGFLSTVLDTSLSANATLGFIAAAARGNPVDYGEYLIGRGRPLEAMASAPEVVANVATDFALDLYSRLAMVAMKEMTGARGAVTRAVLMAGPAERTTIATVLECAQSFGTSNPFEELVKRTASRSYTAGIPCVEHQSSALAKVDEYHRLAIGMRSGLFAALLEVAGRDLSMLDSYLRMTVNVIAAVAKAERLYPAGVTFDAWSPDLPALDRFVMARSHAEGIAAARGSQVTVGDATAVLTGVVECTSGLVKALTSGEGLLLLGLGVGAAYAGPTSAAVGGVAFMFSGVAFTGLAVNDVAQAWEGLDLTQKTAGVCGAAMSAVMTAAAYGGVRKAVLAWTPAELALKPSKMINLQSLLSRGRGQAAPLEEQAAALKEQGGTVADEPVEPVSAIEPALRTLLEALPVGKRGTIATLAEQIGYKNLGVTSRVVFEQMARAYGTEPGVFAAAELRQIKIDALVALATQQPAELFAWIRVGGAMIVDLMPGRPKSLRVAVTQGELAGGDAEVLLAAAGDGYAKPDLKGDNFRGVTAEELRASTSLTEKFLKNDRVRRAIQAPPGARAFSAEEAAFIERLQQASRPTSKSTLARSLSQPWIIGEIRDAVAAARQLYGVPASSRLTGMLTEYTASGKYKSAFEMKFTFSDWADPVSIAFKKGKISDFEFSQLQIYASKGLTQKPFLRGMLKGFDGEEAVSIEEWVPGDMLGVAQNASYAGPAVGVFDALVFLRTITGQGTLMKAIFNKDLHWSNCKIYKEGGVWKVRSIDFDPNYNRLVPPDPYFAATLLRRNLLPGFKVGNFGGYLDGLLDTFASEPGSSRAAGVALLKRARNIIADPVARQDALTLSDWSKFTDFDAKVQTFVSQLDLYLVGK